MNNLHTFPNDIVFQELAKIKTSEVVNLVGMFHMYLIVIKIKCY
jgi:hypothetical protein